MPNQHPLVSSAPREPMTRPRPIPAKVRSAIRLMVRGHDGTGTKPLNIVDAAKASGIEAWTLRKYFYRPTVVALVHAERRAFTTSLIAANPAALAEIRDTAANSMARCRAIEQLEALDQAATVQTRNQGQTPGIVIVIENTAHKPLPATIEHAPHTEGEPVFDPNRPLP